MGSPCEYMCHLHDPERHLKLRFAASSIQVSVRPPTRDDHTSSFVLVDTSLENVNIPQRRLVAYFGGLDLVSYQVIRESRSKAFIFTKTLNTTSMGVDKTMK